MSWGPSCLFPSLPVDAGRSWRPKHVLVIGHSYVRRAEEWAATASRLVDARRAGLRITWCGRGGLRLTDLRSQPDNMLPQWFTPPMAIIVHLGGNDMVALGRRDVYELVVSELAWLAGRFPSARVCWSQIIPRSHWRGAHSVPAINHSVRRLNRMVRSSSPPVGWHPSPMDV